MPRALWFVRIKPSPLGFNPDSPPIETDPRAMEEAKKPYRDLRLDGNVETRFLYATLLSTDLLPFGHLNYRLAVLPIEPEEDHHKLVDAADARKRGYVYLASGLKELKANGRNGAGLKPKA